MGLTWCLTTTHLPSIIIHSNEFSVSSQTQRVDDERRNTNQKSGALSVKVFLGLMFGFTDPLENQLISHLVPIRTIPVAAVVCVFSLPAWGIFTLHHYRHILWEKRRNIRNNHLKGFSLLCFLSADTRTRPVEMTGAVCSTEQFLSGIYWGCSADHRRLSSCWWETKT